MPKGVYERKPLMERFWAKVDKTSHPGGCWIWTNCRDCDGYGHMHTPDGMTTAHRFSYRVHKGEIPKGMFVCHTCDVPACVNPDHLWIGTPQDNTSDMVKKNRHSCCFGEAVHTAKLTADRVAAIRTAYANGGRTLKSLGEEYGVDLSVIGKVVKRKQWKHVP